MPSELSGFGRAISVSESEKVTVSNNTVENNEEIGVSIDDSTQITVQENKIKNNDSRGINVQYSTQVSVLGNALENNVEIGLFFAYSSGTIEDNLVHRTGPNDSDDFGRGIDVDHSDEVTVTDNTVEQNTQVGIRFVSSSGTVSNNEVRNTQPNSAGKFGRGIDVEFCNEFEVSDNVVEQNTEAGIVIAESSGTVSNNEVRDTLSSAPNEDGYTYGHGIHVQDSADVECSSNTIENSKHWGIIYLTSPGATITSNHIKETVSGERTSWSYGDGVAMVNSNLFSITLNLIENNVRCGVLIDFSNGYIEQNEIRTNYYSIVAQNSSAITASDNNIHDNDVDEMQVYVDRVLIVYDEPIQTR